MTPKEKAEELFEKYRESIVSFLNDRMKDNNAKICALLAVNYIIASNPHSNPLNTDVCSTMDYWFQVKQEIEKL